MFVASDTPISQAYMDTLIWFKPKLNGTLSVKITTRGTNSGYMGSYTFQIIDENSSVITSYTTSTVSYGSTVTDYVDFPVTKEKKYRIIRKSFNNATVTEMFWCGSIMDSNYFDIVSEV